MLEARDLYCERDERTLFSGLSFTVEAGEWVQVTGGNETQQLPAAGQRLRVGGMVMPGSVRRAPDSLKVNFSLYDAEGAVTVSYEGILPDLFREGQGVVVQGTLEKGNHVLAQEVLAKHDENYTPPEVEKAMQENHRRPQRADKDTSS
ncbi:cytochrome c maturation protein CcmE [Salmonella enterica]|uniref:cytochrome c maturation protein CcmE n=1 Tax=Salmonella enterica TaxID=28901 RepID=UPI0010FBF332|nr:cytochrome c maturation protein CcmE [Salmonella enterica]